MKKTIHQQDVSIKAPSRQMWRRSLLILAAVCLCFGAVGGKLAVIQIGEYAVWQERAMEQQMSNSCLLYTSSSSAAVSSRWERTMFS